MKVKQAERLIEAHDDVNLAYHTGNQGLGPALTEERASLRRRKQAVASKLDDLERSVQRLNKAAAEGYVHHTSRAHDANMTDDRQWTSYIKVSKRSKRLLPIKRTSSTN